MDLGRPLARHDIRRPHETGAPDAGPQAGHDQAPASAELEARAPSPREARSSAAPR